ncbi:M81 family metallopeptidase [Dongia sp.]|uniref:M81 family metallopeptidase n=1 Tax=Dongia sp. TaxID=1977262 RepID=UPI0035B089B5
MKKKLAVARLWYEGNSFSPIATGLDIFQAREWVEGDAALRVYRDTATEMGAVIAFADSHPDWEVTFLRCAAAPPGGPVTDNAFDVIRGDILEGLRRRTWDAVYLSLHGAMITCGNPTPELELLQEARSIVGKVPLAVTFDLHANLGQAMIDLVDIAIGYKTYPHIDMDAVAARALDLLDGMVGGRLKPVGAIAKVPAIYTSFNMRTTDGPMAEMAGLAARMRAEPGILEATVFGGFAYGDSPFAGPTAMVFADGDRMLAQRGAKALAAEMAARRDRFELKLPTPAQAIAEALAMKGEGPAAITDPADNPLSGGIGDTPTLFRALLDTKPDVPCVFAFFWDPELVAEARRAGIGATLDVAFGGRVSSAFGKPVRISAKVLTLTDGKFRNVGPFENNLAIDVGNTAMFDVEGIKVIATSSCQTPNDPAYFTLHGIDLAKVRLLCVKAKNHFRAGFTPLTRAIIECDAPGPAGVSLAHYDFKYAPSTLYPLNLR